MSGTYKDKFRKNQKFGQWTVTTGKVIYHERSRAYVECKCGCGNFSEVAAHHLLKGRSTRCEVCNNSIIGKGNALNPNWQGEGFVPKTVMSKISHSAEYHHQPYTISTAYANTLYVNSTGSCAITGKDIKFTDNSAKMVCVNPTRGYVPNNVIWVHADIEPVLQKTSVNEFIAMCCEVAQKHQFKKE